jgi:hypothetical protein
MKKSIKLQTLLGLLLVALVAACSKEKAEAVKTAAEQVRVEANRAVAAIRELFLQGVSVPTDAETEVVRRMAAELATTADTNINAAAIELLIDERDLGAQARAYVEKEMDSLLTRYEQFASMFRDLPRGSYFARDAVQRAERHAINLTLEFINFARMLETNRFQFTAQRVKILEDIRAAKAVDDAGQRDLLLRTQAGLILKLAADEKAAREAAIVQCLTAAEACRTAARLIQQFGSTSLSDLLTLTREFLSFSAEISGGHPDVAGLLNRFKTTETMIRSDPHWGPLLDISVPQPN